VKRLTGTRMALVALAAVFCTPAGANYHYVHYLTSSAPYTEIPAKFDLTALPKNTVTVFVSDSGPSTYASNDSFASVLSQVRQAAMVWNSVDTSDLRVSFGGLMPASVSPSNPGIEVVFGELSPGLTAQTFQSFASSPMTTGNGTFYPIQHPITMFRNDMSVAPAPSYLDTFFTTAVHELGHALGLQHTFTASVMTTAAGGRATSRVRPLDADDIAGLSVLYPKSAYLASVGTISGRVTSNGSAVAMASVTALRTTGGAISAFTDPNGQYSIKGLPPDTYYVYVSPLPPDHGITLPQNASGSSFAAFGSSFETTFYPGTRDVAAFTPITVARGATVTGIDFSVATVTTTPLYDPLTFVVTDQTYVAPAYLSSLNTARVAFAFDALPGNQLPQSAQLLGVDNHLTFTTYSDSNAVASMGLSGTPLLSLSLQVPSTTANGPRHLLLNFGTDMFVMPSAVFITQKQPPQVQSVVSFNDGSAAIVGTNLGADSTVLFDGLPAAVKTSFVGTDTAGAIILTPPTGASAQRATVTVFNADTLNSHILQAADQATYQYAATDTQQIAVSPSTLPAGTSSTVDITGTNTTFVDGQVTLGFGTPDIKVWRVWVVSPTRLRANISVLPGAAAGLFEVSVISGFQTVTLPSGFLVQAANSRTVSLAVPLINVDQTYATYLRGSIVQAFGSNLWVSNSVVVMMTDSAGASYMATVLYAGASQTNFIFPPAMATGLATLRIFNGTEFSYPVTVQIDAQAPLIVGALNSSSTSLDATHPASPGDVITLMVANLDSSVTASRLHVYANGIELPVLAMSAPGALTQVQAVVRQSFAGGQVSLTIAQDTTSSAAYTLAIR
jgi:uncharacterized protein (TIGR03437 family)